MKVNRYRIFTLILFFIVTFSSASTRAATLVYSGENIVGANGFVVNGISYNATIGDAGFASRPKEPQPLLAELSILLGNFLQSYDPVDIFGKFRGAPSTDLWNWLITPLDQYSSSHINIAIVSITDQAIQNSTGTMQITGDSGSLTELLRINPFDTVVNWEVAPVPVPAPVWLFMPFFLSFIAIHRKVLKV